MVVVTFVHKWSNRNKGDMGIKGRRHEQHKSTYVELEIILSSISLGSLKIIKLFYVVHTILDFSMIV